MSALRNPVVLLLATAALALVVIAAGTAELGRRAAREEAVANARDTTALLGRLVVQPAVPRGLVTGDPAAVDSFDRTVVHRLRVPDARRIKVWNAEGRIVYSDKTQLIGDVFPLGADEREVLGEGGTDAEVSDLTRPENRFERGAGGLLEVYTRVWSPEGEPLLFEVYYSATSIASRQAQVFRQFAPITLGALGMMVLVATGLLWMLTSRLRHSARVRERLLTAAVDASDAERLRIARDLHDGVVQDLAGASFAVSALARAPEVPADARSGLEDAGRSLRRSLRGLRSLMVEIYPPDLHSEGLQAALDDLLAPVSTRGVQATAVVTGADAAPEAVVGLVWRVAQEAVRNALRHSGARSLTVRVSGEPDGGDHSEGTSPPGAGVLVLEVTDDGCGFDPDAQQASGHFGLRGMSSLIAEAGGRLAVRSSPGQGTTIRLEVPGAAT